MNIKENAGAIFTAIILVLGIGYAIYRMILGE